METEFLLFLILILILILILKQRRVQSGGDPYAWIRPWTIIDMLRSFWLTK